MQEDEKSELTGIADYDAYIQRELLEVPQVWPEWLAAAEQVKAALELEPVYVLQSYQRSPVLVKRPVMEEFQKHRNAMALIERSRKPEAVKLQDEQNETVTFAMRNCVFPESHVLREIAKTRNNLIFDQICGLCYAIARDDLRVDAVKLAKS
jgi:hypothetical protein